MSNHRGRLLFCDCTSHCESHILVQAYGKPEGSVLPKYLQRHFSVATVTELSQCGVASSACQDTAF